MYGPNNHHPTKNPLLNPSHLTSGNLNDVGTNLIDQPTNGVVDDDSDFSSSFDGSDCSECSENQKCDISTNNLKQTDSNYDMYPKSLEKALELKESGNCAFKNGDYLTASDLYSDAIKACPGGEKQVLAVLASNRSACYLSLKDYASSISDATHAIKYDPKYVKAYLRRFNAYEQIQKYQEAAEDLNTILELDPSLISTYGMKKQRLEALAQNQFEEQKAEMVGKLKDFGSWALGKVGLSLDNFKVQQNPDTGSYNIQFEQNVDNDSKKS